MNIEVLYFDGCPNHEPTVARVREVVRKLGVDAHITEVRVSQDDDCVALKFLGSPTVLVNGRDIDPACREGVRYGFACRTFDGQGVPPDFMIERAILEALSESSETEQRQDRPGQTEGSKTRGLPHHSANKAIVFTSLGALVTALLASACCWLPLALIALGVSAGGVAGTFEPLRPWFLVGAVVLWLIGFYLVYLRQPTCQTGQACCRSATPRMFRFNRVILWGAAAVMLLFALFPYYSPAVIRVFDSGAADVVGSPAISNTYRYRIEGMTCPACAAGLETRIQRLSGVIQANVSYEKSLVELEVDPKKYDPTSLIQIVQDAGFTLHEQSMEANKPQ
ncbi:MAG: hypothetical protein Kow00105_16280 [Phycisphaeraceae bacterium]